MMALTKDEIRTWLTLIGFRIKDGSSELWEKNYSNHDNYRITVDLQPEELENCKIDYGDKITLIRKTITNFSKREFLVVLECVNRILEKGYSPEALCLEKSWHLGKKEKGFLDINIIDLKTMKTFLMVECKGDKNEFDKEKQLMQSKGGQLFSYYVQEPETQYLCLYYSDADERNITFSSAIVKIKPEFQRKNQEEIHTLWDKLFENTGLFEKEAQPYIVTFSGIKKVELQELKLNDGRFIFNQFAEILRKNVVSDKTNAFNKMFNLFLCKIVDEDAKRDSEEMDFQWNDGDDNKIVMLRLNDLYKKGMKDYLQINISDYTQKEIDQLLKNTNADSLTRIREAIIELRLYTNNEFAFKEVFDKKTFEKNCKVVKEVVQLLQKYRLKYTTKHQFLGDFFEKLLNTGIKQEVGQFFTPSPLTRFICKSLPLATIINENNDKGRQKFLPYVIDFASGSGHFLTEIMSELDKCIKEFNPKDIKAGKRAIDQFISQKDNFLWANEYVYGIEKDYRLAKTTKVSCFLNGDGDAHIFCADGLDNFYKSEEYKDLLKIDKPSEDNPVFDIVISNPPYAVNGFKNTLPFGNDTFRNFKYLTNTSSEIECLFVERTKQLLREGGCAGIILPSSLLSNDGMHARTRDLILRCFEIKSLVLLGSNTFMATNNYTVIFFLRRRRDTYNDEVVQLVEAFLKNYTDVSFNNSKKIFSAYVANTYPDLDFKSYVDLLQCKLNETVTKSRIYSDYKENFENQPTTKAFIKSKAYLDALPEEKEIKLNQQLSKYIVSNEKLKLEYFILTHDQRVVLVKSGEKDEEKRFLGYEFRNRRGYEGIKYRENSKGQIDTKMFNEEDLHDATKVNSIILQNYNEELISQINESLKKNVEVVNLNELFDFELPLFTNAIRKSRKKKIISQYHLKRVNQTLDKINGKIVKVEQSQYKPNGKIPIISQESELISGYTQGTVPAISHDNLPLVVFGDHSKIFKYVNFPFVCGAEGVKLLKPKKDLFKPKAFYYIIRNSKFDTSGKYSRHFVELSKMDIPVPPPDAQNKIISVMDDYENKIDKINLVIKHLTEEIVKKVVSESDLDSTLDRICNIVMDKENPQKNPDSQYTLIGLENIEQGTGKILSHETVLGREILSVKNKFVKGQVLYGKLRPYLNKVNFAEFDGICSTDILVLSPNDKLSDGRILSYILLDSAFVSKTVSAISGLSLPRISPEQLMNVKIKYPSPNKQKLLIKIIDSMEKKIKEKNAELNKLKQEQVQALNQLLK